MMGVIGGQVIFMLLLPVFGKDTVKYTSLPTLIVRFLLATSGLCTYLCAFIFTKFT